MMSHAPEFSRRAVLRWGAGAITGAAGVWALSALLDPPAAGTSPAPAEPAPAGSAAPTRISGSFVSAARGGISTNWVIALPPGPTAALRPVIALHGKSGNARTAIHLGVEDGIAQLVKQGRPPFAVVSVDGGDTYWHRRVSGQDSGAMVLGELLPMLTTMGLDTSRVGFLGWSMGGYGALLLGARLGPQRTAGICAVSPALFTTYTGSTPGAFDSYDDWRRHNVFGLPALASIPIRVDCGASDRFYPAARQFVDQLRTPPSGGFSPGGHDERYWRAQLPGELAWLGS
jgi:enterochelin esterase-like enzyme